MELRSLFLALLWLVVAPLPDDAARSPSGWAPPIEKDQSIAAMLEHAHSPAQRLHERWLPEVAQHWQRSREIALDMFCGLGVMALALVDCPILAAAAETPTTEASGSGGGIPAPDFNDIRRRSIEERMHSI